jgi:hypothetical protein
MMAIILAETIRVDRRLEHMEHKLSFRQPSPAAPGRVEVADMFCYGPTPPRGWAFALLRIFYSRPGQGLGLSITRFWPNIRTYASSTISRLWAKVAAISPLSASKGDLGDLGQMGLAQAAKFIGGLRSPALSFARIRSRKNRKTAPSAHRMSAQHPPFHRKSV